LKALLRDGVAVPGQVAVTGYNNSAYAYLCEPVLTTVDNKGEQAAQLCVQLLGSCIEKGGSAATVTIQPELVAGKTS
ncbi:substrate-binding domain-containing protein, partial [uncultured Subdoligranulum sp.]